MKDKNLISQRTQGRAISRNEVLREYDVMSEKQNMYSDMRMMSVESPFSSFYAGLDPRRKREVADAGMVSEDRNAMSNLSSKPVHKQYPAAGYYTTPYLSGIVKD